MAGKGFSATPNTGEFRNYGGPGMRSTGAYLIGARPFIIKAELDGGKVYKVDFPYVTRAITVINQDAASDDLQVAFANHANAFDHHAITLANNRDSITMNVRTSSIYLKAVTADVSVEIFVEMTDIDASRAGEWGTSDQSQVGVDTNLVLNGAYPHTAAAGATEIIEQV
jgi:hypothetical protein